MTAAVAYAATATSYVRALAWVLAIALTAAVGLWLGFVAAVAAFAARRCPYCGQNPAGLTPDVATRPGRSRSRSRTCETPPPL